MRYWIPLFVVAALATVGCQGPSTSETAVGSSSAVPSTASTETPVTQEPVAEKALEVAQTPAETGQVIQTAQIVIAGMDCAGCVKETEAALAKVEGFKELRADPSKQEGLVSFDPTKTDVDKLIVAINQGTKFKASKI